MAFPISATAVTRVGRTSNVSGFHSTSATSQPQPYAPYASPLYVSSLHVSSAGLTYSFVISSGPCFSRYSRGDIFFRRRFISSAHVSRIRPTIMQVRDATVGPLSGTSPVSASETSTRP